MGRLGRIAAGRYRQLIEIASRKTKPPRSRSPGYIYKDSIPKAQKRGLRAVPGRPPKLLKFRPEVWDFDSQLGLKLGQTEPKMSGTVPTNRHTTIPNDAGPIAACFHNDPKFLNCEIP